MFSRKLPIVLAATALLSFPVAVMGQPGSKGGNATTTVPVGGGKGPVTGASLISRYTALAGSAENATSLVNGLRNGTDVRLTGEIIVAPPDPTPPPPPDMDPLGLPPPPPPPDLLFSSSTTTSMPITVEFKPPTGNMGWGNVDVALAFMQAQFTELYIQNPTANEIKAALMGGEVEYGTSTPRKKKTLPGILQLRAGGMGWGQIATQLGYQLQ
jgi:hypothetical protein